MKKIIGILILLAMLTACGPSMEEQKKIEHLNNTKSARFKVIDEFQGYSHFEIVEVDGHLYLSTYNGGIVHMESCSCKSK